jgi:glycosyltransferase involved in cell wall biosynthesis
VALFCRDGSPLALGAKTEGLEVLILPKAAKKGPNAWWALREYWRGLAKDGPFVLHLHAGGEPWFHLPWLFFRPKGLRKVVLHFHIWIRHVKRDPWHFLVYRQIDEIWTSSSASQENLWRLLPVPQQRVRVVPYGRNYTQVTQAQEAAPRQKARAALGLGEADVLALTISRIEPLKGILELILAFERVANEDPHAHLALVGNVSPGNAEAEELWVRLQARVELFSENVQSRFHYLGYLSDCSRLFSAADFYVLPSHEECMSLAMLDAAIVGLPIVGTRAGGTPSVAIPGRSGVLVEPADKDSLFAGMWQMYSNAKERAKLAAGARELGRTFDQEKIFRSILEAYT